jgi:trehalose utilization protein
MRLASRYGTSTNTKKLITPSHAIAAGLDESFEIAAEEMYGEFFDIPAPDTLVFVSWFEGGVMLTFH